MATPQTVIDRKYMLVYDRGGTEIHVYDKAGKEKVISTDLPVERADISESGEAAVIMSDGGTHVVDLYGTDGKLLAGGRAAYRKFRLSHCLQRIRRREEAPGVYPRPFHGDHQDHGPLL